MGQWLSLCRKASSCWTGPTHYKEAGIDRGRKLRLEEQVWLFPYFSLLCNQLQFWTILQLFYNYGCKQINMDRDRESLCVLIFFQLFAVTGFNNENEDMTTQAHYPNTT